MIKQYNDNRGRLPGWPEAVIRLPSPGKRKALPHKAKETKPAKLAKLAAAAAAPAGSAAAQPLQDTQQQLPEQPEQPRAVPPAATGDAPPESCYHVPACLQTRDGTWCRG